VTISSDGTAASVLAAPIGHTKLPLYFSVIFLPTLAPIMFLSRLWLEPILILRLADLNHAATCQHLGSPLRLW
jgi:hypothetical protein